MKPLVPKPTNTSSTPDDGWSSTVRSGKVCHTVLANIGDMVAALTPQLLNTQRGASRVRALESTGTLVSVRTQLQSRPAMLVHEDHFDADPRLLNTPDFVINLETGDSYPHAPGFLTRQQTLVTPAFTTIGHYETSAPRFFQLLYILADGRSWVIPFLQRWFGYCLTGKIGHQHFLFIQGLPKTGKTQLVTIMLLLMHTYATTLRSIWMMKNSEKRFDMVKVIGKRMGFVDETQKGSTFDEERLSNVAGSLRLQAEPKGGEEFDFDNRVKLILTGNHRPNFVSGEAGGLMRRLLLLKVTSKPLSEIPGIKVQKNFAEEVVKAEGPAILMWAVEGAMLDYADKDGKIFDQLKIPMEEAAKSYTRENSMYWQWIEARMRLGPLDEVDIDLLEAFEQFKGYVYEVTRERCRDRRTDFKQALKAMLRDRIEFDTRTKGPYKGRAYIRGLGHAQQFEEGGNVVSFGTALGAKNV
jgi:putative DNA primase/helicase